MFFIDVWIHWSCVWILNTSNVFVHGVCTCYGFTWIVNMRSPSWKPITSSNSHLHVYLKWHFTYMCTLVTIHVPRSIEHTHTRRRLCNAKHSKPQKQCLNAAGRLRVADLVLPRKAMTTRPPNSWVVPSTCRFACHTRCSQRGPLKSLEATTRSSPANGSASESTSPSIHVSTDSYANNQSNAFIVSVRPPWELSYLMVNIKPNDRTI